MFAQVDEEGHQFWFLSEITDHRKDASAIPMANGMIRSANGQMKSKITTRGWELLVQFKDERLEWVKLKDFKAANPVELAEYNDVNHLADKPAFKWWVPHAIRKRNWIINKVKSKYWKVSHKLGIRLPKTVDKVLQIDRRQALTIGGVL
eukprot:577508-Ditylum_brightwellii.AAC.1